MEKSPWGTTVIGHNGGNGVFSADFRRYVDDGLVVITAAADSQQKAWKASEPLARIAHGETVSVAPETVAPLGDDARARVVKDFVAAFNDPDMAVMRTFRATHMIKREGGPTDEQREQMTLMMKNDFGTLKVDGVLENHDDKLTVRTSGSKGGHATFRFAFTPENKIAGLGVEAD
jgi:hypothetical protein